MFANVILMCVFIALSQVLVDGFLGQVVQTRNNFKSLHMGPGTLISKVVSKVGGILGAVFDRKHSILLDTICLPDSEFPGTTILLFCFNSLRILFLNR